MMLFIALKRCLEGRTAQYFCNSEILLRSLHAVSKALEMPSLKKSWLSMQKTLRGMSEVVAESCAIRALVTRAFL